MVNRPSMPVSGRRAHEALANRRRMVHAAYRVFCRDGYSGATMRAIAEEGGVAVQTLYYTFHTKAALLGEALGAAIVGFDQWREPPADPDMAELLPWHSWWAELESAPTSADALDVFVTHGVGVLERVAPLVAAMHGGAGDPEATAVVRIAEERRVAAYREVVRAIAGKPDGLGSGLDEARGTDLLVVLFSAELYHALAAGRGWSRRQRTAFFRRVLASELLP